MKKSRLRLRKSALVAPNYSLVLRDEDEVRVNSTVPDPDCLLEGEAMDDNGKALAKIALSTCQQGKIVRINNA